MTYQITVSGHTTEDDAGREEAEKRLLDEVVFALSTPGVVVGAFSFVGNKVQAKTFAEARKILGIAE